MNIWSDRILELGDAFLRFLTHDEGCILPQAAF
jgi:hypothetical protein